MTDRLTPQEIRALELAVAWTCGDLPNEPSNNEKRLMQAALMDLMGVPVRGQEQVGAPPLDLTREEAKAVDEALTGYEVDPGLYRSARAKLRAFLAGAPEEDDG